MRKTFGTVESIPLPLDALLAACQTPYKWVTKFYVIAIFNSYILYSIYKHFVALKCFDH